MKRLFITTLLILISLAGVYAQAEEVTKSSALEFKSLNHDFGTMTQGGEKVSYEFVFTNNSEGPVVITRTANSCRCISVVAPKRPIKPGAQGGIRVTFDPKDKGVFNKAIDVYANIPGGRLTLLVTGEVK